MRNLILLIILGLLTAMVVQNLSPSLSLVFLGTRSRPLPLSLWIFLSFLLGIITAFLIARLFHLSNYLTEQETEDQPEAHKIGQERKSQSTRIQTPRETVYQSSFTNPEESSPKTVITPPSSVEKDTSKNASTTKDSPVSPSNQEEDDWSENESSTQSSAIDDNWETEEPLTPSTPKTNLNQPRKDYEVKQEPKTKSWSGSSYSFGYRDGQNSGVGKSESVYDADYRVIIPPFRQPPLRENDETSDSLKGNNDEDWGLDFDDEDKPPHQKS